MPKPEKKKIKEREFDVCPICGGQGTYFYEGQLKTCHGCKGIGYFKVLDFSAIKEKRKKVEDDRKAKEHDK